MKKFWTARRITVMFMFGLIVASTGISTVVEAAPYEGTIYGRTTWRGYFDNHLEDQGVEVLPPSAGAGGLAIPHSVNSVNGLINHLRAAYNSGNNQRRTGAAFIVHTMLGKNGSQASRTITNADWNELTTRMNDRQSKGRIAWTGNVSGWINSYYQPRSNDDAFYRDWRSEAGITFRDDDGRIVYRLIRRCANPIGDGATGLPEVRQWQARDDSFIQQADPQSGDPVGDSLGSTVNNARPGERYIFNHRIMNQGPHALDRNVTIWRNYTYPNASNDRANEWQGGNNVGANQLIRGFTGNTGVIPATAAGQQWCSRAYVQPRAYNNTAQLAGTQLCVNVPYAYDLTPHVSVGGDLGTNVEQGSTGTTVDPRVENAGPTQSRDTAWQLIRFEVAPDAPRESSTQRSDNNDSNGCDTHNARPGVGNCEVVSNGNGVFSPGNNELSRYIHDTGDTPIGSRICFVLSISTPTAATNPSWGHSQPACIVVVKKPKIQVHGGDLWAGRQFNDDESEREPANITTGTSTIQGTTYGSWAEYGVTATGSISGIASGAGLASGRPQAEAIARNLNHLTFANTPAYGGFTTNPSTIPDYAGIYGGSDGRGPGASLDLPGAEGKYYTESNVTLNGGSIPKGRQVVVHANNVTINSSIAYEDGYANLQEIPQVVIIAEGNISISPEVERIDAWLISKGTIYTCNERRELTIDVCNRELVINGPVAANEISLRRTHGSDAEDNRDKPAELFNLRPDALLSAYARALGRDRAQTVYQVELPPRF